MNIDFLRKVYISTVKKYDFYMIKIDIDLKKAIVKINNRR